LSRVEVTQIARHLSRRTWKILYLFLCRSRRTPCISIFVLCQPWGQPEQMTISTPM
jgi:hypothetical protein